MTNGAKGYCGSWTNCEEAWRDKYGIEKDTKDTTKNR